MADSGQFSSRHGRTRRRRHGVASPRCPRRGPPAPRPCLVQPSRRIEGEAGRWAFHASGRRVAVTASEASRPRLTAGLRAAGSPLPDRLPRKIGAYATVPASGASWRECQRVRVFGLGRSPYQQVRRFFQLAAMCILGHSPATFPLTRTKRPTSALRASQTHYVRGSDPVAAQAHLAPSDFPCSYTPRVSVDIARADRPPH